MLSFDRCLYQIDRTSLFFVDAKYLLAHLSAGRWEVCLLSVSPWRREHTIAPIPCIRALLICKLLNALLKSIQTLPNLTKRIEYRMKNGQT
jgi:hypothetical protein